MKKKSLIIITFCTIILILAVVLWFVGVRKRSAVDATGYNLLIVTLDTTRADHIGAYGYEKAKTPNLDQLANQGTMFENCYSPVPLTLPAHSSLFTGKYPLSHKVRNNGNYFLADDETTLAEKFKTKGYQTYAVISSYVLMSKFGLNQGFDLYDDSLQEGKLVHDFTSEIKADLIFDKFSQWFLNREKGKNFFAWVHFYDPHRPYEPPEEYRKTIGDKDIVGLYDAEITFMDLYLGKIIQLLKQENALSDTVVVLVGDHGEAFGEHTSFGHSLFCYEENLKVPLVFYNDRLFRPGLRIQERVNLVDIMSTILEAFGMEDNNHYQGKSFVNLLAGRETNEQRTFYIESIYGKEEHGWAPLTGIIDEQYKYLSLPEAELYDLDQDKKEQNNLFREKNSLARNLDKKLMNLVKKYTSGGLDSKRTLSEADRKHLQSLGYISTFSQKAGKEIDPKKGVLVERQYDLIETLVEKELLDSAEERLLELQREYPDVLLPQYFDIKNSIYQKRKNQEKIIENWKDALAHFPENSSFAFVLATEYFNRNQLDAAEALIDQVIEKDPKNSSALILKGRICNKKGMIQDTLRYYEECQKLEPLNYTLQSRYAKLLSENNQPQKAGAICDNLLKNQEVLKDVQLKSDIGIILTEIHRDQEAFQLLTEVLAEKKDIADAWNYLGIIHLRRQELQEAKKAFLESIALDPKVAKTLNNLGTLYLTMFLKNPTQQLHNLAVVTFNKALDIDPELVSALNGRASAYKFVRRTQDALKDWQRVIELKPDFTDGYFNIAVTLLEAGRKKEALNYLEICRDNYYEKLSPRDKNRLARLIQEATS